jgi:hypothetical protein
MLDTPCSEVVWRVLATHSIRQFPLHFPFRASPCAITFQLESTAIHLFYFLLARYVTRRHLSYNAKFKGHILSDTSATDTSKMRKTTMFVSDNVWNGISFISSFITTRHLARNLLRIKEMLIFFTWRKTAVVPVPCGPNQQNDAICYPFLSVLVDINFFPKAKVCYRTLFVPFWASRT